MDTTSYWMRSARLPRFPSLTRTVEVDVAVVGGGICGITAAYLLKKAGKTVALLEREQLARIDTGHTTAHLTCVTDEALQDLVKYFGRDAARSVWEAGLAAIDQIYSIIRDEQIEAEFVWVPAYQHSSLKDTDPGKDRRWLKKEAETALDLGFPASFMEAVPFFERPGVRYQSQAKFHPLKYLAGFAGRIPGDGSYVFENTSVDDVEEKPLSLKAGRHRVRCSYLVLATHNPLMGKTNFLSATLLQSKLALYTSYVVGARIPSGLIPEASFWDISDPYYYLRIEKGRGFDYAIFGGEDHKTGQSRDTQACFRRLERQLLKCITTASIDARWSGQVIETNDGLPLIGETASQQFAATGFGGNGMTFGTLGAMMARDAVTGVKNPWTQLFSPHRKKVRGGLWHYLQENKDYPFYLLRDRFAGGEKQSAASLTPGEGKILKVRGQKVAAYKDESGKVTMRSPVCTHLGCIVHWNQAEKTWDCPCHGSRFKPTGEVISGPAEAPLGPAKK